MLDTRGPTRRGVLLGLAGAAAASSAAIGQPASTPLRTIAAERGLVYGSALPVSTLDDAAHTALLARECAVLVATNDMKWDHLAPTQGTYDFRAADRLMEFAKRHDMAVRGHTLLWHRSMPRWLTSAVSAAEMERLIETHATTVVGRYAGRIKSWDVVNEAIDPVISGRPDGLRGSLFLARLGEAYIDRAYRAARAADPACELVYNDYGVEHEWVSQIQKRREKVLDLLKRLLGRGVPLDAFGVQGHLATREAFDGDVWLRWLEQVRGLGLRILVTELDVTDSNTPKDIPKRDAEVAALYKEFLTATLACKAVTGVITWGISDRHSWVVDGVEAKHRRSDGAPPRPLPYDKDLVPKPAHAALAGALAAAPKR